MTGSQHGEWLAIEVVARCYGVEVEWVLRVEELGVLHRVERRAGAVLIAASELDRLAAAVRWHRHLGVGLDAVAALLSGPRGR